MKSKPMPETFKCSPSHPSCPTYSLDNLLNPGTNTNQLPSNADQVTWASIPTWVLGTSNPTRHPGHLSPHQCSGLAPMCNGYLVVQPTMIDRNLSSVSIATPTLFPI